MDVFLIPSIFILNHFYNFLRFSIRLSKKLGNLSLLFQMFTIQASILGLTNQNQWISVPKNGWKCSNDSKLVHASMSDYFFHSMSSYQSFFINYFYYYRFSTTDEAPNQAVKNLLIIFNGLKTKVSIAVYVLPI